MANMIDILVVVSIQDVTFVNDALLVSEIMDVLGFLVRICSSKCNPSICFLKLSNIGSPSCSTSTRG